MSIVQGVFWLMCAIIDISLLYQIGKAPFLVVARDKKIALVAAWSEYFKTEVAGGWIFHDGSGN